MHIGGYHTVGQPCLWSISTTACRYLRLIVTWKVPLLGTFQARVFALPTIGLGLYLLIVAVPHAPQKLTHWRACAEGGCITALLNSPRRVGSSSTSHATARSTGSWRTGITVRSHENPSNPLSHCCGSRTHVRTVHAASRFVPSPAAPVARASTLVPACTTHTENASRHRRPRACSARETCRVNSPSYLGRFLFRQETYMYVVRVRTK
jgi:hypothetical protein